MSNAEQLNEDAALGISPVSDISWSDDSIKIAETTFFKGEKNRKKRIYVMTDKPKFARVHYKNGSGYFVCRSEFHMKDGAQVCVKHAKCCELLGEAPKLRFGVIVLLYDTDKEGRLKTKDPQNLDFEFQMWSFGEDKFASLRTKHEEWSLTEHDLLISCSDEQYQKIEIDVLKNALWKTNPSLKARVDAAWAAYNHKDTQKFLGKILSEAEIAIRLGGEAEAETKTESTVNGQNLDEVLKGLKEDSQPKAAPPSQLED
jgi:hypothetical protein